MTVFRLQRRRFQCYNFFLRVGDPLFYSQTTSTTVLNLQKNIKIKKG